jgi:hypothetical protein
VWRKTATPVAVEGPGLAVVLRSSDVLIPSWGGEILLRLDAIAPVAAFPHAAASVRVPERLVIVVDGAGPDTVALATVALDNLGGNDRAGIVDTGHDGGGPHTPGGGHIPPLAGPARGARPVLPLLPGSHHTLLRAAVERLVSQGEASRHQPPAARDLAGALAMARGWITAAGVPGDRTATPHVLVLTDGIGAARGGARLAEEVRDLGAAGVQVLTVATDHTDAGTLSVHGAGRAAVSSLDDRKELVDRALPPPGDVVLDDVRLSTSSVPAPARVIEVSGGDTALGLYSDHLMLGQVYAGEARTEVARVALPPWVPGEPLELTVTARYLDVKSGRQESAQATIRCRYSDNVEEIAKARHGDVIAYASALAMVRRLHRAFLGSELDRPGGIRRLATMQATTLADLARVHHDRALATQSEMLTTLLGVIDD